MNDTNQPTTPSHPTSHIYQPTTQNPHKTYAPAGGVPVKVDDDPRAVPLEGRVEKRLPRPASHGVAARLFGRVWWAVGWDGLCALTHQCFFLSDHICLHADIYHIHTYPPEPNNPPTHPQKKKKTRTAPRPPAGAWEGGASPPATARQPSPRGCCGRGPVCLMSNGCMCMCGN